jgi:hypothetical protein
MLILSNNLIVTSFLKMCGLEPLTPLLHASKAEDYIKLSITTQNIVSVDFLVNKIRLLYNLSDLYTDEPYHFP